MCWRCVNSTTNRWGEEHHRLLRQVHIYELPSLKLLVSEALDGEVIPRSVLFADFEGVPYLLCALGDGQLHNFHVDATSGALR